MINSRKTGQKINAKPSIQALKAEQAELKKQLAELLGAGRQAFAPAGNFLAA